MNDSLDTWLDKEPHWYSVPMYRHLSASREREAQESADNGKMLEAMGHMEASRFYAERAKTIGAFLRDAA